MAHAARALPSFEALYQEVIALPTGVTGEILERGVLRTMSRPGKPHRLASKRAGRDLGSFDENPIPIAPDWACEILSPTTARDDRRLKLPLYARAGVGWIWLLDTAARQVEIYETVGARATFAFAAAEQPSSRLSITRSMSRRGSRRPQSPARQPRQPRSERRRPHDHANGSRHDVPG
jgi:hypothetical protein